LSILSQMRIDVLKTLKVITWRLKVVTFQGIKKNGSNFKVKVLLGLSLSMGSRRCSLSISSSAPPLARASQKEVFHSLQNGANLAPPRHCSPCFDFAFLASFHCCSPCVVAPLCASLLLSMFHYIILLCASLLFVFRCSSCFFVVHRVLLLLCVSLLFLFCCCSSCFAIVPTSLLLFALLLLLLCCYMVLCCSYFFAIAWCFTSLSRFAILLPSQVPFYPLLFHYSYVLYCYLVFIVPLPRLVPPPIFLYVEIQNCLGESLKAFKLLVSFYFYYYYFDFF